MRKILFRLSPNRSLLYSMKTEDIETSRETDGAESVFVMRMKTKVCALVAAVWTMCMKRQRRGVLRILEVLAVILVALVIACPLGGMLWHFHDMLAGFFPDFWLRKLLGGIVDGLMVGPRLIFYSFPYNLIGLIVGYFATTCLNSFFCKAEFR